MSYNYTSCDKCGVIGRHKIIILCEKCASEIMEMKDEKCILTWKGKPNNKMSRNELLEVIQQMSLDSTTTK